MLTREDYSNFLKQIGDLEKNMERLYGVLVDLTSDGNVKNVCSLILRQEKEHLVLVNELTKLFEVSA